MRGYMKSRWLRCVPDDDQNQIKKLGKLHGRNEELRKNQVDPSFSQTFTFEGDTIIIKNKIKVK